MSIEMLNGGGFAFGAGTASLIGGLGWFLLRRILTSLNARNANDNQQVDMLERQEKYIERLEIRLEQLKKESADKDETIREYWATITETKATLQIIQNSQAHLEEQNSSLKDQVKELTASNMNLVKQIAGLRQAIEVPR